MAQGSDLALVEAVIAGDSASFTELCRRYYPAMVAIAHCVLGDRHLAEDVAQETFANAVRKLSQLKNKNQFAAWLAAICRNVAKDTARANPFRFGQNVPGQYPPSTAIAFRGNICSY